jgi:diguanylate cyclase (GGDEF)-like protein
MLDPVNILIVTVLSSIMSLAILGSLKPAAIPGVGRWIGAYALASVAILLFSLQRLGFAFFSIFVANALLALAVLLVLEGCRQFFGLKPRQWPLWAAWLAMSAGIAWWNWVTPSLDARIAVASAFHALVYALIGWTAWRYRPRARPPYGYRFVTWSAWLGALAHGLRGLIYGAGWARQSTLLEVTPFNVGYLALGILVLPAISIGMVMLAHDRLAERLERLADFDELTGAFTRRAFLAKAGALLEAARGTGEALSIAIVDIDHFKAINDRYGHAAGDHVLAHFGRVVAAGIGAADLFGRLGGEEFAVLFPGVTCEEALVRLDALRVKTAAVRRGAAQEGSVTFSAGVVACLSGDTLAALMARADAALYAAKTRGRDRVVAA